MRTCSVAEVNQFEKFYSSGKAIDCIVISKTGENHNPKTIQSTTSHCASSCETNFNKKKQHLGKLKKCWRAERQPELKERRSEARVAL